MPWVVVLMTGSVCDEYPGTQCVMDVLGPFPDHDAARAVAAQQPDWAAPHIMALSPVGKPWGPQVQFVVRWDHGS